MMERLKIPEVSCADQRGRILRPQIQILQSPTEDCQPAITQLQPEQGDQNNSSGELPIAQETPSIPDGCMSVEFFAAYQNS